MTARILVGDCRDVMAAMEPGSIDAICTDPPYMLNFMGRSWDRPEMAGHIPTGKPGNGGLRYGNGTNSRGYADNHEPRLQQAWHETWAREAYRVLKPGGHLVAFGGTRTSHRLVCAIEDAGFEIRDSLVWVYASGFPKSLNLDKTGAFCSCGENQSVVPYTHGEPQAEHDVRPLRNGDIPPSLDADNQRGEVLLSGVSQSSAPEHGTEAVAATSARSEQSGMEGRGNVLPQARQLQANQVREMPARPAADGAEGWVRNGTSAAYGADDGVLSAQDGSGASHQPRPAGQRPRKPRTLAGQPNAQASGTWPRCDWCGLPRIPRGLGTALKPSHEPIVLARKPLSGTVAANVATHGTGALNIDASRIGAPGGITTGGRCVGSSPNPMNRDSGITEDRDRSDEHPSGRWPANLILSHVSPQPVTRCHACDVISDGWHDECPECGHVPENDQDYPLVKDTLPGCVPVGVRRVKSQNPVMRNDQKATGGTFLPTSGRKAGQSLGYADPDGTEAVAAYECVEGCAVAEMDRQSGVGKSPDAARMVRRSSNGPLYRQRANSFAGDERSSGYGDTGGASRFFLNIPPEPHIETEGVRWKYVPKASRRERNCGLDGMPDHPSYMVENGSKTSGVNGERYERTTVHQNGHPCVKPVALLRWLSKLVCQPGGTILDPFMGSGSGGMAALLEGFDYIGIEQDAEYAEIARRRIAHVERHGERWMDAAGKAKQNATVYANGNGRRGVSRCPEHNQPHDHGTRDQYYQCGCRARYEPQPERTKRGNDPHDLTTLPLFAALAD